MNKMVGKSLEFDLERMSRFTFWIVFGQAILVVVLLVLTIQNISDQSARAEHQRVTNDQLIQSHNELVENQFSFRLATWQSMSCMLSVGQEGWTGEYLDGCLQILVDAEAELIPLP